MDVVATALLGSFTVICPKCTRWQQFRAETQQAAQMMAKKAGWRLLHGGATVCKKCPG